MILFSQHDSKSDPYVFVSLCLFTFGPSIDENIERINDLNDDACHNVRRVNHSFLNKQKTVINEQIITKQLQYKVSISTELADDVMGGLMT